MVVVRPLLWLLVVTGLTAALAQRGSAAPEETEASRRAAIEMLFPVMVRALEDGRYGQARNICDQAALWEPDNPVHPFNLACIEARAGGTRLPHAIAALKRALALGFSDVKAVAGDPDLQALRADPQFPTFIEHAARNAFETPARNEARPPLSTAEKQALSRSPTAPPLVQPGLSRPIDLAALTDAPPPAAARFDSGRPVGLFFMTRPWTLAGSVEKLVWYFAPDGTVYQSLEHGFSAADLAAHRGPRGMARLENETLTILWSDGRTSRAPVHRSRHGFGWDRGTFTPVQPFPAGRAPSGTFVGTESLAHKANRAALARSLELRTDGTFRWKGVSLLTRSSHPADVYPAASGRDSVGRWRLDGYTLVLVDAEGRIFRRIAFPWQDTTGGVPGQWVFAGTLFAPPATAAR